MKYFPKIPLPVLLTWLKFKNYFKILRKNITDFEGIETKIANYLPPKSHLVPPQPRKLIPPSPHILYIAAKRYSQQNAQKFRKETRKNILQGLYFTRRNKMVNILVLCMDV